MLSSVLLDKYITLEKFRTKIKRKNKHILKIILEILLQLFGEDEIYLRFLFTYTITQEQNRTNTIQSES